MDTQKADSSRPRKSKKGCGECVDDEFHWHIALTADFWEWLEVSN